MSGTEDILQVPPKVRKTGIALGLPQKPHHPFRPTWQEYCYRHRLGDKCGSVGFPKYSIPSRNNGWVLDSCNLGPIFYSVLGNGINYIHCFYSSVFLFSFVIDSLTGSSLHCNIINIHDLAIAGGYYHIHSHTIYQQDTTVTVY